VRAAAGGPPRGAPADNADLAGVRAVVDRHAIGRFAEN